MKAVEGARRFARENISREPGYNFGTGESENLEDVLLGDLVPAERDELVEHGLGIAHAAFGASGDGVGSRFVESDAFVLCDVKKVLGDDFFGDAA